jgi:hypothetical protein
MNAPFGAWEVGETSPPVLSEPPSRCGVGRKRKKEDDHGMDF